MDLRMKLVRTLLQISERDPGYAQNNSSVPNFMMSPKMKTEALD